MIPMVSCGSGRAREEDFFRSSDAAEMLRTVEPLLLTHERKNGIMTNAVRGSAMAIAIGALAVLQETSALGHSNIDIVASNWKFTPATITLHVGEATTLHLTSSEGVHGLQSDELAIPMTTISPGAAKTVEVTPKKPGKYVLHCAVFCGAGHADMILTINVVQ